MKKTLLFSIILLIAWANHAMAEIYKRVDPDGRITYSNVKTTGSVQLDIGPDDAAIRNERAKQASQPVVASKRTSTPSSFPKVDQQTQNQRDDKRKEILQSELEAEKQALVQAQQAYAEGESTPEIYRKKNADGSTSTFRNVPKFDAKMQNLRADVESHQRNIELLQKEINALH